jgi:hypothetical protein
MAKPLVIRFIIDESQAVAATGRVNKGLSDSEKVASRTAAAIEKANERAASSVQKLADLKASIEMRAADRSVAGAQKLADQQTSIDQKAADRQAAIGERSEERKVIAKEKATLRKQRDDEAYIDKLLRGVAKHDAQWKKSLTDEEIARKVSNQKLINSNNERIEAAMKAAGVEYKGMRNGWEGANMLASSISSLAMQYLSLGTAVEILGMIGKATNEAADNQKRMTDEYIRYRDALREQLDMQGKGVTTKTVLEAARFEAETGMKSD